MGAGQFSDQICRIWQSELYTHLEHAILYADNAEGHHYDGGSHRAKIYLDLVGSRSKIADILVDCIESRLQDIRQMKDIYDPGNEDDIPYIDELQRAQASIAMILRRARKVSAQIRSLYSTTETLLHPPERTTL